MRQGAAAWKCESSTSPRINSAHSGFRQKEFGAAKCGIEDGAYCAIVRHNAPSVHLTDIAGNIEVEANVDAICSIAVSPQTWLAEIAV
jgi:hypothetical protein